MRWTIDLLVLSFFAASLGLADTPPGPPTTVILDKRPTLKQKEDLAFLQLIESRLKTNYCLEMALRNPSVVKAVPEGHQGNSVVWLQKHLKIEINPKKHTVMVSLPVAEPEWQAQAVNAIAEVCCQTLAENDRVGKEAMLDDYQRLLEADKKHLESEFLFFFKTNQVDSLEQIEVLLVRIAKSEAQIQRLQSELNAGPRTVLFKKAAIAMK